MERALTALVSWAHQQPGGAQALLTLCRTAERSSQRRGQGECMCACLESP